MKKSSFPLSRFNEYLFDKFFSHSSDKEELRNFKLRFLEFRAGNKINEGWHLRVGGPLTIAPGQGGNNC